ncbi:Endo-1,4-beta-xylanase A [Hypsizygus marmoreus]|uniref:Endo-1,4-beta-xylanase A n=1 Tax=Hypsizygus marmoreus TaxID=39966 RepID=A0A369JVC8_HYPMA|nr:Endo-1,4-beta-xylanase A [Hypsizygus marmoreus]
MTPCLACSALLERPKVIESLKSSSVCYLKFLVSLEQTVYSRISKLLASSKIMHILEIASSARSAGTEILLQRTRRHGPVIVLHYDKCMARSFFEEDLCIAGVKRPQALHRIRFSAQSRQSPINTIIFFPVSLRSRTFAALLSTMFHLASALILGFLQAASAQTPPFKGALLLEPGLTIGKCLTAASNKNGAPVTIEGCANFPSQKWTFTSGSVKIFGNKCLEVPGGNARDGTKLQISSCSTNDANQQFTYTGDNRLQWTKRGKCVDLTGGKQSNGNRISISTCTKGNVKQIWDTGYSVNDLPEKSQSGQYGINSCGTSSSQTSKCQTAWMNSAEDFCLWGPPQPDSTVGDTEHENVAWCTKSGRGTRVIPNGALKGVHFVRTHEYVQVTGVGDFTKLNIKKGDSGGELDNRGADGNGNPSGGLVYGNTFGNGTQYHEWTSFMSDSEFCFRACTGPDATRNCNHIYDLMGCTWNIPANYEAGKFENCDGNNDLPMGVYGTSTWHQGVSPTLPPHPAASSSNCHALPTVTVGEAAKEARALRKRQIPRNVNGYARSFPRATPAA